MLRNLFFWIIVLLSLILIINDVEDEITTFTAFRKEQKEIQNQAEVMKLEIPDWNWNRLIVTGTINNIGKSFATLLEGNNHNQIIAGHNIDLIFHDLHFLKIGMQINFTNHYEKKEYQVNKILIVDPTEINYLQETELEQLTLITCTDNDRKRLIIICNRLN